MGNQHIEPMSPRLVLSLWRERWGKDASAAISVPYIKGKLNEWGDRLTQNHVWSLAGMVPVASVCCLTLFFLTIWVVFPAPTQILFSTCLVGAALYLRRHKGMLITLILISMSLIASARYIHWRFSTVLSQDDNLASILALGLCLAELHLWIVTALSFLTTIWPLKRISAQLPADNSDWPTIDIFITVHNRPQKAIEHITMAALALEWPANKLKIYLLDDRPQAGIKEFAKLTGVNYLIFPDRHKDKAEIINQAASQTRGSLIALLQCDELPDPKFLKKTVGWFIEDSKLGMIQTPLHVLAPEASENNLNIFLDGNKSGISCALIRRSALLTIDKIETNPVPQDSRTALKLQRQGYRNAFIGFTSKKILNSHTVDKSPEPPASNSVDIFLVDSPLSGSTVHWKKRLSSLKFFLNFYFFVPRFVFFTAPLAYLLAGIDVIQAAPTLLFAYFLPHLIHAYFATGRLEEKGRFTAWGDLKEVTLAWYFLLPTALSLLRTEVGNIKDIFSLKKKEADEPFDWIIAWPYGIILGMNLVGFLVGIQHELRVGGFHNSMSLLCLAWVLCNLLLLMATLAVANESRHLRRHIHRQLRHAAMIQLPSGRTITGVTENFPDPTLKVSLPVKPGLEVGTIIGLSIFRDHREFSFPAKVAINDDQSFWVVILENSRSSYQELGMQALSRGEHWPLWLPGRNADRPLPKWLSKPFLAALGKVFSTAAKLGLPTKVKRLVSWINTGKR